MDRRSFLLSMTAGMTGVRSNRLGVVCHLGKSEESARKTLSAAASAGFQQIQVAFPWNETGADFLRELPAWIRREGLKPVVLSAYVNCLDPQQVLMSTRAEDFIRAIEYTGILGCRRLIAWTGGYGRELMQADPRNYLPSASDAILSFLEPHGKRLEARGLILALETYNTLACPDAGTLRSLLSRLPESMTAVLDPPNLTPVIRYHQRDQVLQEMMQILQGRIGVVHLKDFRLPAGANQYELPAPLGGVMNYPLFMRCVAKLDPDIPRIAEHFGPDQYDSVRRRLIAIWNEDQG